MYTLYDAIYEYLEDIFGNEAMDLNIKYEDVRFDFTLPDSIFFDIANNTVVDGKLTTEEKKKLINAVVDRIR